MNTKIEAPTNVNATLDVGHNVSGPEVLVRSPSWDELPKVSIDPQTVAERLRQGGKDNLIREILEADARGATQGFITCDTFGYHPVEGRQMPLLGGVTVGMTAAELVPSVSKLEVRGEVVLSSPDAIEALRDVISHNSAWRSALTKLRIQAEADHDSADASYYQHELNVLERVMVALQNVPLPAWKAPTE